MDSLARSSHPPMSSFRPRRVSKRVSAPSKIASPSSKPPFSSYRANSALPIKNPPCSGGFLISFGFNCLSRRDELHLEHPGPELARHQKRIGIGIIGDPVQHRFRVERAPLFRRDQPRGIDQRRDPP